APERDGGKQQRQPRVVETTQGPGGNGLGAVGDEEAGTDDEQGAGQRHRLGRVGGLGSEKHERDRGSAQHHDQGHAGHEGGRQPDGGKARPAAGAGVAASGGLADAYGGRKRHAKRDHEQHGGGLERDLVGRQRRGADRAHHQGGGGEHAELEQEG